MLFCSMGEVLLEYDIKPESPEVDINKLAETVKETIEKIENVRIAEIKEEPFVFGMKKLKVKIIIAEIDGLENKVEEALNNIEGVSSVELTYTTRL